MGSINLKGPPSADGDVEIGWGLIENARRKGYATEASAAVLNWVVQQPGISSISATIPDDNHPSQRLAARLGVDSHGRESSKPASLEVRPKLYCEHRVLIQNHRQLRWW